LWELVLGASSTPNGIPVVEVRSGEKEYAAEMATTIMDSHLALRAALLTGIAGSRNSAVNVGDVVLGAYVVDRSSIHFNDRGFLSPYTGVEMEITSQSNLSGALVGGPGQRGPTSPDAKSFGLGPSSASKSYVYLEDLAASAQLMRDAVDEGSNLGSIPLAAATGEKRLHGVLRNRVLVGVIGSANQWTEPLVDQEIQNALDKTDAGGNEGMGFARTNARFGVPWLIVRGISDGPWYPSAYGPLVAPRRLLSG
jgi:adenosylhomocysteine nucleosidase